MSEGFPKRRSKKDAAEVGRVEGSGRCIKLRTDGNRCKAWAVTGSQWCFFHDPAGAEQRADATTRGGAKKRAVVLPPETPDFPLNTSEDVCALVDGSLNKLLRGQMDPKTAYAAGYLLNIRMKAWELGMKARELGKLEQRVSKLETAQKDKQPTPNLNQVDDELERQPAAGEALETPFDQPYPVDADDGAALEAVINHHVVPWEHFHSNELPEWLQQDPDSAAGKPAADALENAMRGLIGAAEVAAGQAVELACPFEVPLSIPLIDGQWIDRHMVELAEYQARLESRGLEFHIWPRAHHLAPLQPGKPRAFKIGEYKPVVKADERLIAAGHREARAALAKFPDRTKEINGRTYLHIDDYRNWPDRYVRGNLPALDGIVSSSWNRWIDRQGGEGQAELAGIKVYKLRPLIKRSDFFIRAA